MIFFLPAPMLVALALAAAGGGMAFAQAPAQPKANTGAQPKANNSAHNSDAPIDWVANRIEVQDQQHRAILTGDVRVVQQEMTLTADRVTALYTGSVASSGNSAPSGTKGSANSGPQVQRLDASGHVVVTRPTEIARGEYGIYDLDKRLVTLIGNVTLDRTGPNAGTVRGGRLVINLNTNQANMDGSAVGGTGSAGTGGRVSGRFTVPQHNDTSGGTPPPAKPATPAKPAQH
jgi:lipopolysaccharide export system protein LptA